MIPTIEQLTDLLNKRRNELMSNDPQFCYLQGQLAILKAQEEDDAGNDPEDE